MPHFSKSSLQKLSTIDINLQILMKEVIKYYDITILCGFRNEKEQTKAYDKGNSKLKWPNSKHNKYPSKAIDIVPYPIDWNNIKKFCEVAGCIKTIAKQLNINIEWGGDWKNFKDYPHWQLKEI